MKLIKDTEVLLGKADEVITKQNVCSISLGYGLYPKYLKETIGKKAMKNLTKGIGIEMDMLK